MAGVLINSFHRKRRDMSPTRMLAIPLGFWALVVSFGAEAQAVGSSAPAFELPTAGKPVRLADLKGQVVYVDFWASWCVPCKLSFPFMNDMHAKYGPLGLTIVAISVDRKREDADRFLRATPARFVIAYDAEMKVADLYQPKGMPTSYLIGTDGKVRAVHGGFRLDDREKIEKEIRAALGVARK